MSYANRSPEQHLIDIMFEMVIRLTDIHLGNKPCPFKDREAAAKWVAHHLREGGFDTEPMGMSWGMLKQSRR